MLSLTKLDVFEIDQNKCSTVTIDEMTLTQIAAKYASPRKKHMSEYSARTFFYIRLPCNHSHLTQSYREQHPKQITLF